MELLDCLNNYSNLLTFIVSVITLIVVWYGLDNWKKQKRYEKAEAILMWLEKFEEVIYSLTSTGIMNIDKDYYEKNIQGYNRFYVASMSFFYSLNNLNQKEKDLLHGQFREVIIISRVYFKKYNIEKDLDKIHDYYNNAYSNASIIIQTYKNRIGEDEGLEEDAFLKKAYGVILIEKEKSYFKKRQKLIKQIKDKLDKYIE